MIVEGTRHDEWFGGPMMFVILGVVLTLIVVTIVVMVVKGAPRSLIGAAGFGAGAVLVMGCVGGVFAVLGNHEYYVDSGTAKKYQVDEYDSARSALYDYYGIRYEHGGLYEHSGLYAHDYYVGADQQYYETCSVELSQVDDTHFKILATCDGETVKSPHDDE